MADEAMKTVGSLMGDLAYSLSANDKQQIMVELELLTLLDLVQRAHMEGYYTGMKVQKARQDKQD